MAAQDCCNADVVRCALAVGSLAGVGRAVASFEYGVNSKDEFIIRAGVLEGQLSGKESHGALGHDQAMGPGGFGP
jgi:hypothetical protein